jgi:hypothetical protein
LRISNTAEFIEVVQMLEARGVLCTMCGTGLAERHNAHQSLCVECAASRPKEEQFHKLHWNQMYVDLQRAVREFCGR